MPDTPYVPSSRLEKIPPSPGSWLTWWAADALVAAVTFVGTLLCVLVLLSAWALHPGDNSLQSRLDPWAVWLAVGLGYLVGVLALTVGKDHRSLGQNLAEVKTEDMSGRPASWARRALRVALVLALVLGLAMVQWLLAVGGAAVMIGVGLLSPQRRGPVARIAGLRDYQIDVVPVRPEQASPQT